MTREQTQELRQAGHPEAVVCRECGQLQALDEMRVNNYANGRMRIDPWCKTCIRRYRAHKSDARTGRGQVSYETASYRRMRLEVLTAYSGGTPCCSCCGEQAIEFLALDHIDGGGRAHRQRIGNNAHRSIYRDARMQGYPTGFRVLCHNCNQAIGLYGYCPHKTPRTTQEWVERRASLHDASSAPR